MSLQALHMRALTLMHKNALQIDIDRQESDYNNMSRGTDIATTLLVLTGVNLSKSVWPLQYISYADITLTPSAYGSKRKS